MKRVLVKTGSWFLLLIFSVIQVLPALHHHSDAIHTHRESVFDKGFKHKVDEHSPECSICSFIAHKQIDYPSDLSTLGIICYTGKPLNLNINFCQQFFESAIHSWTNKGPPTV